MRCSVSLDPCVPPPAHIARDAVSLPLHSPAHRIGSRHFHRYHHVRGAKAAAPSPADTCGKHFANDNSGKLADRPTDGGPPSGAAKGKAVVAKLAAGGPASLFGAASLLGAAALAGALAAPPGPGIPTPGPAAPASAQASVAPLAVSPFMPGSPGGSPLPLSPLPLPHHPWPGGLGRPPLHPLPPRQNRPGKWQPQYRSLPAWHCWQAAQPSSWPETSCCVRVTEAGSARLQAKPQRGRPLTRNAAARGRTHPEAETAGCTVRRRARRTLAPSRHPLQPPVALRPPRSASPR